MAIDLKKTTDYDCPYCKKSKLAPKREHGKAEMINGLSPEHRVYHETADEYDPREIHAFALALECTNPECKMMTIVVGRLDGIPDDSLDVRVYDTTFCPSFFYPPIDVLNIPPFVPVSVAKEIRRSFTLFFCDPTAAANALRVAVEKFMDEAGMPKGSPRPLTLHKRLVQFRKSHSDIAELLVAVKWFGNDGSHDGQNLTQDDVLKGYKVFFHALQKYYDDADERAKAYAGQIGKGRGF